MQDKLLNGIQNVLSFFPQYNVPTASEEVFQRFTNPGNSAPMDVPWVDYTEKGELLHSAVTDIADASTRILATPSNSEEVQGLLEVAWSRQLKPGESVFLPERSAFCWCVPIKLTTRNNRHKRCLRVLLVTDEVLAFLLDTFNWQAGLTKAEKYVVFQIIAGLSLKEAAQYDGVREQTKREQLKSVFAKTGCSGQVNLVRLVMGQMVDLVYSCDVEASNIAVARGFYDKYFARDAEFITQRLPNGSLLRYLEAGPREGHPVLSIHGLHEPLIGRNTVSMLYKHNIRLIVPIRRGYLEDRQFDTHKGQDDFETATFEDLSLFIQHYCPCPIDLFGPVDGGPIALRFCHQYPQLIRNIVWVGVNLALKSKVETPLARQFTQAIKKLAVRPTLVRLAIWRIAKNNMHPEDMRNTLRPLYGVNKFDAEMLDAKIGGHDVMECFLDYMNASVPGLAEDYRHLVGDWLAVFPKISKPILIVQGEKSPVTKIEEVRKIASSNDHTRLEVIEEAGHFLQATHSEEVWEHIAKGFELS